MWNLSGFDSEAVGFDSVSVNRHEETNSSTQTTEFNETNAGTQSVSYNDNSTMTEDIKPHTPKYSYDNLNAFLRRVVPSMMVQLNENQENLNDTSDSDEEELFTTKFIQQLKVREPKGSGDQQISVLDLAWSSGGNSLAVTLGKKQHQNWCTDNGVISIYTIKRSAGDKLVHCFDINEKNCVSVLKYHPSIAPLLAYGTVSGEVSVYDFRNQDEIQLTSPSGCHGSKRVTALLWADQKLSNTFLTLYINKTGKRRATADQILVSAGCDGNVNVWRINVSHKVFENIVSYNLNGSRKMVAPDISCLDFVKTLPLRPTEELVDSDIFVVGTTIGNLLLCKIEKAQQLPGSEALDPVYDVVEGHATCVLSVAFNYEKSGIFISLSIDSELRIYNVNQSSPLKIISLDTSVSCIGWLHNNPWIAVVGSEAGLQLYDVGSGNSLLDGAHNDRAICQLAVSHTGTSRVAGGDAEGTVYVWELPACRFKRSDDLNVIFS